MLIWVGVGPQPWADAWEGEGMATRLIRLSDGVLVEAEIDPDEPTQVSGRAAERVAASFDRLEPILLNVCRPIASAWNAITDLQVDQVQVELGLSFEGEGNLFVSKARAGANLTVTLLLRRPPDDAP